MVHCGIWNWCNGICGTGLITCPQWPGPRRDIKKIFPVIGISSIRIRRAHETIFCNENPYTGNMMMSSNGNIDLLRVTGHLCGEFTGHRWIPRTKASDVELWCILWSANKRLSKKLWGWWFETPLRPLWRHCNETTSFYWAPDPLR